MNKSILLAGVGGQGTVLASKLIAQAAIDLGFPARTAETIGMAQRGGCVVSHVAHRGTDRFSHDSQGYSADIIIGFEPVRGGERCLPYLKEDGALVVSDKKSHSSRSPRLCPAPPIDGSGDASITYPEAMEYGLIVVDAETVCQPPAAPAKVLNVALLGAACGQQGLLGLFPKENAFKRRIARRAAPKERFVAMNTKALDARGPDRKRSVESPR